MTAKQDVRNQIIKQGVLPLFYSESCDISISITKTLYRGGIRVIEYTNRGEAAEENFAELKKLQEYDLPGLILGIGTIKSAEQADRFINAGADFIIAPLVNADVAVAVQKNGLLWIPGCMTPTEIYAAQQLGATLVKLFPSNVLGPGFLAAVKDIFPEMDMMPTGGVEMSLENISSWFRAGASAVGMGSKLITNAVIKDNAYGQLYTDTLQVLNFVNAAR